MTLRLVADMRETLAVLACIDIPEHARRLVDGLAVDLDDAEAALELAVERLPELRTAGGVRLEEDELQFFARPAGPALKIINGGRPTP